MLANINIAGLIDRLQISLKTDTFKRFATYKIADVCINNKRIEM